MATLLLQAAGGLLGGVFGPAGAAIGAAAGSLAGHALDTALLTPTRHIEGARISGARPLTAEEGTPIARIWGHARLSGTVIWATRFEEAARTERQGGKGGGGTTVTTYSYFGNLAIGLCEGPVAAVKRVWADGKELDLTSLNVRFHNGDGEQMPDPLIEAKQGAGNAPAYRHLAYLVLERLPLKRFGNRIPQFQVEVIRPVGELEKNIRAICVIPGSTEHGYAAGLVTASAVKGATREINRHMLHAGSDWEASIDELQAVCPALENVSLIVSWFGDDLRAGECTIRPGVVTTSGGGETQAWSVAGLGRTSPGVHVVSQTGGAANYGGTPADASVVAAIQDLKARGLKVTLCPFLLMDIPDGNSLPDPWSGGGSQPAHPWRGRITCDPAIGQPGTADQTAAAATQITEFHENAEGYRRMVNHYANLATSAGGVDAFVIGSELRGLTQVRDDTGGFPFVGNLQALAAELRATLGPETKITYGADWTEYFGYHPADGTGDVFFHLDPLWADANIDAVGIDNYMPLSDWRDADAHDPDANPDGALQASDRAAFRSAIEAGEGYEWYYASDADRRDRIRTPITDGLAGKPWVFRYKDLRDWWSNPHYERVGGSEDVAPTAWAPMSKPIWFTELGCPAVDKGATQPNVFPDPKSSESALPRFSNGGRDDGEQRAFLDAHHEHWGSGAAANPVSPVYGEPMVDPARIYCWAWDARPFPAFPMAGDVWGDGANWAAGHWLNGRLGGAPMRAVAGEIVTGDAGGDLPDAVQGVIAGGPMSARDLLEPLMGIFGYAAYEEDGVLAFAVEGTSPTVLLADDEVTDVTGEPLFDTVHAERDELPTEVVVYYRDGLRAYRSSASYSRRLEIGFARQASVDLPCVTDPTVAPGLADRMLAHAWARDRTLRFGLPLARAGLAPGAVFAFASKPAERWIVTRTEFGDRLAVEAVPAFVHPINGREPVLPVSQARAFTGDLAGAPDFELIDLPMQAGRAEQDQLRIAAWSSPPRTQAIYVSPGSEGFEYRMDVLSNAVMGVLTAPLSGSFSGRFDRTNAIELTIQSGEFESVAEELVLGGRNLIAIRCENDGWEVAQFRDAEETAPGAWRLTGLLRGQGGTDDAMATGAAVGARAVLLDRSVVPAGLKAGEIGLDLQFRVGPAGRPFTDRYFATVTAAGGIRARLPLSPVHLKASRNDDGSLALSWIRRTRIDGDNWAGTDVPLGEESERYAIRIRDGGAVVWETEAETQTATVDAVNVTAFGLDAPGASLDLGVAQISVTAGEGIDARKTIILP
jgi:hypothetical protein